MPRRTAQRKHTKAGHAFVTLQDERGNDKEQKVSYCKYATPTSIKMTFVFMEKVWMWWPEYDITSLRVTFRE